MFWRKSELKKKIPNIASVTSNMREVRAGVRPAAEEREVEHRQPLAVLEHDERDQRHDAPRANKARMRADVQP